MRRITLSLLALCLVPAAGWCESAIPAETLQMLKGATVFVKADGKRWAKTGSGFLIKADGKTGYVVTNRHVIAPPKGQTPDGVVRLVFWSGSKKERTELAEVVATDPLRDLAILRVSDFKGLPEPIDLTKKPDVTETMTIYMVGFPFGEELSASKGNPEITFGKGTVSSIRHSAADDVAFIQIDGELNPGNSGGPIVNAKGELVGVAVARFSLANTIGAAIPGDDVRGILAGRVGALAARVVSAGNGGVQVHMEAALIDPMHKIKEVTLYYIPTDDLKEAPKRDKDGWKKMPGAKSVPLKIDKEHRAAGFVRLLQVGHRVQVSYVNGDGDTILTGATALVMDLDPSVISVIKLPAGGPTEASKNKAEVARPTSLAGGESARLAQELIEADAAKQERMLENLRESKGSEYTQALLEAIPKLEGDTKKKAREALAERMSRMTGATLRDRLRDDDAEMRRAAALAAAMKEDTTHVPRLIELLDDMEASVSRAAYAALKSLSGKDFGPAKDATAAARAEAVAAWKAWWREREGK